MRSIEISAQGVHRYRGIKIGTCAMLDSLCWEVFYGNAVGEEQNDEETPHRFMYMGMHCIGWIKLQSRSRGICSDRICRQLLHGFAGSG